MMLGWRCNEGVYPMECSIYGEAGRLVSLESCEVEERKLIALRGETIYTV